MQPPIPPLTLPEDLKRQLRRAGWEAENPPQDFINRLLAERIEVKSQEDAIAWHQLALAVVGYTVVGKEETKRHAVVFCNITKRAVLGDNHEMSSL
jgi:hypothetical protein